MSDSQTPLDPRPRSLWAELRHRRVVRVAIAYAAVAFAVLQGADLIFPALGIPDGAFRALVIVTLVGFPVALALSWSFDLTPEGLRRAREGGEVLVGRRRLGLSALGGLGVVIVAAGWFLMRPAEATSVVRGTEVLAVLPFRTTGADLESLNEGMVDLVSRNLEATGVLRTLDPRTVLYAWNERGDGRGMPFAEELVLGATMGAGSILTGSVTQAGNAVRMDAEIHLVDGTRIASAQVNGTVDGLMSLVDSLSVQLVREIWQSSGSVPRFDLSAVTSGSADAIGAFLEGERLYRASRWQAAIASFREALTYDSTFALAYYRISNAMGWGNYPFQDAQAVAEQAARFADRLPPRERTLVAARSAPDREGSVAILEPFVERHPDDFEGVYWLADDLYHSVDERALFGARSLALQMELFTRAHELDPNFVATFIHPLEIAFRGGELARIRRWVSRFDALQDRDEAAAIQYRRALEALERPDDPEAAANALAGALRGASRTAGELEWQASKATLLPVLRSVVSREPDLAHDVVRILAEAEPEALTSPTGWVVPFELHAAAGRTPDAVQAAAASGRERDAWTRLALAGVVRADEVPASQGLRRSTVELVDFLEAVDAGDATGARALLESIQERAGERGEGDPTWLRIAQASDGLVSWMDGSDEGLNAVADALRRADAGEEWALAYGARYEAARANQDVDGARGIPQGGWPGEYAGRVRNQDPTEEPGAS